MYPPEPNQAYGQPSGAFPPKGIPPQPMGVPTGAPHQPMPMSGVPTQPMGGIPVIPPQPMGGIPPLPQPGYGMPYAQPIPLNPTQPAYIINRADLQSDIPPKGAKLYPFNETKSSDEDPAIFKREVHPEPPTSSFITLGDRIWLTWLLTIIIFAFSYFIIASYEEDNYFLLFIPGVIYIGYWVDAATCKTCKLLKHFLKTKNIEGNIQHFVDQPPFTRWGMECYHYETVHRYNRGHSSTSRQKRVTYHNHFDIRYTPECWSDYSPVLEGKTKGNLVRFYSYINIAFPNKMVRDEYNSRRNEWIHANSRDVHNSFTEKHILEGMDEYMLTYKHRPGGLISHGAYILATFAFLGWIYRMYLLKTTYKIKYEYIKIIHHIY